MQMKFFRKFLLIWMIVWLPASGALAAVMPLSVAINVPSAGTVSGDDQDRAVMPCHGTAVPEDNSFGQGCSHCVLCHLAGALVMPELPIIATLAPTHIFDTAPSPVHPSFVPELISPPPRALAH